MDSKASDKSISIIVSELCYLLADIEEWHV